MQEQNNSPENEAVFTVTFTVTVDPADYRGDPARYRGHTADDIEFGVSAALSSDDDGFPYYYTWSDITVTKKTAPEPPVVPMLPWDLARVGAAALRDTGIWEYPVVEK